MQKVTTKNKVDIFVTEYGEVVANSSTKSALDIHYELSEFLKGFIGAYNYDRGLVTFTPANLPDFRRSLKKKIKNLSSALALLS